MARSTGTANLAASLEVLAGAPLDARTVVPTVSDLTVAANFPYKYVGMPVVTQDSGDMYILIGNDVTDESNWKKIGSGGGLTQTVRYNIVTKSVGNYDASITVNKYVDDELESSTDYLYSSLQTAVVIDHRIQLQYYSMNYHLTLLADSTTEQAGYTTQWAYNATVNLDQFFISEAYKPYVVDGYYKSADHLFYEESTYTTAIPGKVATIYVDLSTSKSYRYDSTNQIFVRLDEEPGDTPTQELTSAELAEVKAAFDPTGSSIGGYPILFDEGGIERQVGWYRYSNGTKKPAYEKSFVDTLPVAETDGTPVLKQIDIGALIDKGYIYTAFFRSTSNNFNNIPFINSAMNRMVYGVLYPNDGTQYQNKIVIRNDATAYSGKYVYITIRYTKTTDTPA